MKHKKQSRPTATTQADAVPKALLRSGVIDKDYQPISFNDFLSETVKGKTPDATKKFRDFLRANETWQASMSLSDAVTFADVEKRVDLAMANYRKNGIPVGLAHELLVIQFTAWWKGQKSEKARENRMKRPKA